MRFDFRTLSYKGYWKSTALEWSTVISTAEGSGSEEGFGVNSNILAPSHPSVPHIVHYTHPEKFKRISPSRLRVDAVTRLQHWKPMDNFQLSNIKKQQAKQAPSAGDRMVCIRIRKNDIRNRKQSGN